MATAELVVPVKVLVADKSKRKQASMFDVVHITVGIQDRAVAIKRKLAAEESFRCNPADVQLIMGGKLLPNDYQLKEWSVQPERPALYSFVRHSAAGSKQPEHHGGAGLARSTSASEQPSRPYDPAAERRFIELMRENRKLVKEVEGDGNCMFRSIADQVYSDEGMHPYIRDMCMDHLERERDYFAQFVVTEDETFDEYVQRKRKDKCFGNHIELQVFAELFSRPIEIYESSQTDATPRVEVGRQSEDNRSNSKTDVQPIRLSYHNGNHYNSVEDMDHTNYLDALGLPGQNGGIEEQNVEAAIERSELEWENEQIDRQAMEELSKQARSEEERMLKQALEASMVYNGFDEHSGGDGNTASEGSGFGISAMAAIDKLVGMGFDRSESEAAYVSLDGDIGACATFLAERQAERHAEFARFAYDD